VGSLSYLRVEKIFKWIIVLGGYNGNNTCIMDDAYFMGVPEMATIVYRWNEDSPFR